MGDALALPFSVSGINSGGYTIIAAFSMRESGTYNIGVSAYDVGCIVNGGYASAAFICPIYFSSIEDSIIYAPTISSDGFNSFSVITIKSSYIQSFYFNSLSLSIMLFKAP